MVCQSSTHAIRRTVRYVLMTLLCIVLPKGGFEFLVVFRETAVAAMESPVAPKRREREKAKENSLAMW